MEKKKILIVDDSEINIAILNRIISSEYDTVSATNGAEALRVLKKEGDIAGILLDLAMPVMDGYDFLSEIKRTSYAGIPIVVTTGYDDEENETKALELGAWDYVGKPYSPKILLSRLNNAIARSNMELFSSFKHIAEYDEITELYNMYKFQEVCHNILTHNPDSKFAFIYFDVNRFSLINSFYGMEAGDNLLRYFANKLRELKLKYDKLIVSRVEADQFIMCTSYNNVDELKDIVKEISDYAKVYKLDFDIVLSFGIYLIEDNNMRVRTMVANTHLAAKSVKGNYVQNYAFYNKSMSEELEKEQIITNNMTSALEEEQFCVYLQPKYDINQNRPVGAEALVRWRHGDKGMISPGDFIPVFERNGFILKLDAYMWEKTCQLLAGWISKGYKVHPISVNVSRVNLYNPNFVEGVCELTDKYKVPRELFQLEITESAYTDNFEVIRAAVDKLHEKGFTVLMDDFGSGYSSLGVLRDIAMDVLKIDMGFFKKHDIDSRSRCIVESVVNMARMLKVPTISEGVETKEQVDFLKDIGCEFVQGYYFARPMPVEDYEKLMLAANA